MVAKSGAVHSMFNKFARFGARRIAYLPTRAHIDMIPSSWLGEFITRTGPGYIDLSGPVTTGTDLKLRIVSGAAERKNTEFVITMTLLQEISKNDPTITVHASTFVRPINKFAMPVHDRQRQLGVSLTMAFSDISKREMQSLLYGRTAEQLFARMASKSPMFLGMVRTFNSAVSRA